jgi:hypothetical protein
LLFRRIVVYRVREEQLPTLTEWVYALDKLLVCVL